MAQPPALPVSEPPEGTAPESRARADCRTIGIVLYVFALIGMIPVLFLGSMLLYIAAGSIAIPDFAQSNHNTPELMIGAGIMAFVLAIMLIGEALQFWAAWSMRRQRNWTLCMVMAALLLVNLPLGTPLGIWMLLTLQRPDVRAAFGRPLPAMA